MRQRETGMAINALLARDSVVGGEPFILDRGWTVKFCVPFSAAASKNNMHRHKRYGVYKNSATTSFENELILEARAAIKGRTIFQNKLWIDLFVQKPHHRGDAINVIDVVCDAIKRAVDLDDRWFCINQIDWEIAKQDPQIYIGISQRDTFDALVCSSCGQIQPLDYFTGNRSATKPSAKNKSRICKDCRQGNIEGCRVKLLGVE